MGFWHITFGVYGGSEPEAADVPDSIFATNITITRPEAVSVSISLPSAINVSLPDDE